MDLVTLIIVLHDCDRARFLQCVILYAHPDGLSKVKSCSISSCGRGDHQLRCRVMWQFSGKESNGFFGRLCSVASPEMRNLVSSGSCAAHRGHYELVLDNRSPEYCFSTLRQNTVFRCLFLTHSHAFLLVHPSCFRHPCASFLPGL
jgi:hypothetical protein